MIQKFTLKTILIGDSAVGKTSLVTRFVDRGPFQADYKLTVGIDISSKEITLASGDVAILSIHDVAGQTRFESVRSIFYRGTHLALCVFDVTRENSLEILEKAWIPELDNTGLVGTVSKAGIQKILVGNKIDLEDMRMVSQEEAEEASKRMDCIAYIETSAKENTNVDEAFTLLAEKYIGICKEG
ncbi:MAG: Rab family GTPase [Candidatus Odinarchaeota archaeon]